eukprot:11204514-Lingulodinium_polyedra.AAC.1
MPPASNALVAALRRRTPNVGTDRWPLSLPITWRVSLMRASGSTWSGQGCTNFGLPSRATEDFPCRAARLHGQGRRMPV